MVLSLILTVGLPSLQAQIERTRTLTLTQNLQEAMQATRHRAVSHNGRATLAALGSWENGWQLFDDDNHNGRRDSSETLVFSHRVESHGVSIEGNDWVKRYISYVGTGESRHAGGSPLGGFLAGTITVCSENRGSNHYKLVLSRMGRVRRAEIDASECFAQG
ncbi:GspH/FimT family pseudopilin [Marinimicrobium agarilyticum]|uniref:GspH/FimT family pseudopilin n=1 Tax=Marinimicrobium agarilyticum TaxID=306546 RepID=UPI0024804CE0|nr:GspH/FimT family protein [Marinimicrobium agarilyticum]